MASLRAFFVLCLVAAGSLAVQAPVAGQTGGIDGGQQVTGTAVGQVYRDGPNGTVFTFTEIEVADADVDKVDAPDGRTIAVRTHGGIRSDGMAQYTSHQARFTVGNTYRMQVVEAPEGPGESAGAGTDAAGTVYSVIGGDDGLVRVGQDGSTVADESNNDPDNFVLQPYSWAWTLPDNPPVFFVNPNTTDVSDEVALVRAAFDTWEDDPGSSMDWTYGGTTTVTTTGDDGTNAVFWADTPNPADDFLARTTTFYIPSTGQAVSTDILFNNDFNWIDGAAPGAFDIITVGIHESGHSLGLGHAPNSAAIMYRSVSDNTTKRVLSLGDRGGVAALYPQVGGNEAVTGRVSFSDGAAAPDVKLNLFTENRAQFLDVEFTDGGGNYSFPLPGAGCYVVTFIAPAGVTFVASGTGFRNRAFCATAGETVTGIDAVLVAPGSATTSSGRVTFSDGSAASGVKLNLFTQNRESFINFALTDGNGDYSFNLLGAGCYVTTFIAPTGSTFSQSGTGFLNRAYCATEGEAVIGIDAVLVGAASLATIGDRVTNAADGSGEAGVKIVLYRANGDGSRGQWLGPAFTDGAGVYSFTRGAGCYVLDFVAPTGRTWVGTGGPFKRLSVCVTDGETNNTLDGVLN